MKNLLLLLVTLNKQQSVLALNEEEAKHKVKYLNENAVIPFGFKGYTVKYEYTAISLETSPSWLLDMK
ncbi:hypothetical protein IANJMKHF_00318 [Klebsiella phage CPRSA]|nr:hypothetical protein IANJMKHF_00318 [Klebsiella phage CPRSA]